MTIDQAKALPKEHYSLLSNDIDNFSYSKDKLIYFKDRGCDDNYQYIVIDNKIIGLHLQREVGNTFISDTLISFISFEGIDSNSVHYVEDEIDTMMFSTIEEFMEHTEKFFDKVEFETLFPTMEEFEKWIIEE